MPTELKPVLDRLYNDFNYPDSATDPIQIVRRYARNDDREVVGFCAAALAFGRVASVLQSIERLMTIMGPRPAEYVRQFDPRRQAPAFAGLVHRWTRERDIVALLWILRQMFDRSGSIEGFFLEGYDPAAPDLATSLDSFSSRAMALDMKAAYGRVPARPGVCYFFPRPSKGSACKRLVVPLDTHVIRVGRCLQLTKMQSPGWKMASVITASLAKIDPDDPTRYDFSICHLGMMNACGFSRAQADSQCPLRGVCRPRARTRRRSRRSSARR